MRILNLPTTSNSLLPPNFISVAKQCLHHPNTLYISTRSCSNLSAWDLLRRILDEKRFVQEFLPYDIVHWITDESRQEIPTSVPSKVDDIEKEVTGFRKRLEIDRSEGMIDDDGGWIRGWKKWEGEWIPRPIGV